MVCKIEECRLRKEKSMKKRHENEVNGKEPKPKVVRLQKVCKFKRSFFSEEDDAASSAILLLACVVCNPYSF